MDIQINSLFKGVAHGSVASRLMADGMNVNAARPWIGDDGMVYVNRGGVAVPAPTVNATLRKDEWKQYDEALLMVTKQRLVGVAGIMRRGLVYRIANGLGTTVLEYEDMSDLNDAEMAMDGVTRGTNDRPEFDMNYLPLPIIFSDLQLSIRELQASRTTGRALDTTQIEVKGRKIAEKMETIFYQGASGYAFGGGTIRGLCDHPSRNTVTLATDWADSAADGEAILDDVLAMKQELIDAGYYGPFILDIPSNWETKLDDDFKANSDRTIRERIEAVSGIAEVKVADKLTASNAVMYQATSDVVRQVEALPVTTVQWDEAGGMITKFKIMTISVPQIRSDQEGNSGVCHLAA